MRSTPCLGLPLLVGLILGSSSTGTASASIGQSWGEDHDGDGLDDHFYLDIDEDGNPEFVKIDDDEDGIAEWRKHDSDDDGDWDEIVFNDDIDSLWDRWEADRDGDGKTDSVYEDSNNDGRCGLGELVPVNEVDFPNPAYSSDRPTENLFERAQGCVAPECVYAALPADAGIPTCIPTLGGVGLFLLGGGLLACGVMVLRMRM